ncbi:hypothetical protein LTR93_011323 [Exophiala xenobiotica]|nr:hypothetical protein LTR93_011323 [Exophiala xenobiotica]
MAKSYVDVLKDIPPTFPTSKNDYRVEVPGFPVEAIYHSEYYHAQNPSQKGVTQLREIIPNFSMLSLMLRRTFIEDEILHAARHILENRNVPLWVSFALQAQLHIQRLNSFIPIDALKDWKNAYESLGVETCPKDSEGHLSTGVTDFGQWTEGSDMEMVIRNQDPTRIFVGARPQTLLDGEKRLYLAMGMSTTSLARGARKGMTFKRTNAKQREYEKSTIAANLFGRWMGRESRKHDEAAHHLRQLLFGYKYRYGLAHKMFVPEEEPAVC